MEYLKYRKENNMQVLQRLKMELSNQEYFSDEQYIQFLTENSLVPTDEYDKSTMQKQLAGEPFNIASPKQVGEILFAKMKIIEKPKKTKTGQYVTSEEVLQQLKGKHEIVGKILEHS